MEKIREWIKWLRDRKTTIIIILCVLLFFTWKGNVNERQAQQDLIESLNQRDSILNEKLVKLEEGTAKTVELAVKEFKASQTELLVEMDDRYRKTSDRIAKSFKKDLKDLQSSVGFTIQMPDDTITNTEYIRIPNEYGKFIYEDDTLRSLITTDSLGVSQVYNLKPIKLFVDVFAEKKFFKPANFSAFVTTDNPKVQIPYSNVFVRKNPKPQWAITVGGGIGFDPINKLKPIPTVGLFIGKPIKIIYR